MEALEPSVDILSVSRQVINSTEAGSTLITFAALLSFFRSLRVHHLYVLVQPHHWFGTTLNGTDRSDSQMNCLDMTREVTFLIEAQIALRTMFVPDREVDSLNMTLVLQLPALAAEGLHAPLHVAV